MSKRTLLLFVAAVIAAFTALSVKNRLSQAPPEVPSVQGTSVVIAKHDLSPGSFIQAAQDLDWGLPPALPAAPLPVQDENAIGNPTEEAAKTEGVKDVTPKETYLYQGAVKLTDFNGAVVRRQLHAGDPVPANALMKAGTGGLLSAVLNPGMRAVSISVPPNSNGAPFVSGFVLPGDYVDLIVTKEFPRSINNGRETEQRKIIVSKTFIQNVRVLAADQALDNPDNKALVSKTITVEVTPTQAQEIAVAAELGKISVSLRSAVRAETPEEEKAAAAALANSNITDSDIAGDQGNTPDVSEQVKMFRDKETKNQTQNLEFYRTQGN